MTEAVKHRVACRLCGGRDLALAFALEPTPPANAFVSADDRNKSQEVFPLNVHFCRTCTHVQLLDIVNPELLFGHYVYVSGTSPVFVKHFEDYADAIADFTGLQPGALVVDIGSNDGTLLRAFRERHHSEVLGIDPARNLAQAATAAGIETIADFFSPTLAQGIANQRGKVSVITANNVFAHIDDLGAVADAVRLLLTPDGVFVFEVSYLLDVVENTLFDTIYHEHLSYHAVKPLIGFFERHGLEMIEAVRVPTHGGSLRGIVQLQNGPRKQGASIREALALEQNHGLDQISTYIRFADQIGGLRNDLRTLLTTLRNDGKRIAGFGAPAKATTLMYHFRIGPETIDYIIDDSPLKQGLYSPGLHVPIVSAKALDHRPPDYILILAWNFAKSIIAKNVKFKNAGGHFIVPVPKVEVV